MFLLWGPLFSLFISHVLAFEFSIAPAAPASCDKLTVTWTGGTAPFTLNLIPVFGVPRAVPIPATAKGTFDVPQLPYAAGQQLVMTITDATGFGAGGISPVYTVAKGAGVCVTTSPVPAFSFTTPPTAPLQCAPYTFGGYAKGIAPLQIIGIVPAGQAGIDNGQSFVLKPTAAQTSFDWTANIKSGTNVLFMMVDSKGNQGGSTKLLSIGASADQACLTGAAPAPPPPASSSAPAKPGKAKETASKTSTTKPTATSEAAASAASGGSSSHAGAIAGGVIGALVGIGAVAALLFFLRKRQQQRQWTGATPLSDSNVYGGYPPKPSQTPFSDSLYPHTPTTTAGLYTQATPLGSPYTTTNQQFNTTAPQFPGLGGSTTMSDHAPASDFQPPVIVQYYPGHEPDPNYPPPAPRGVNHNTANTTNYAASTSGSTMSYETSSGTIPSQEKALAAAAQRKPAPKFVLHTDAEEVEELPPQYSDRRVAAAAAAAARSAPSSSSRAEQHQQQRPVSTATVSLAYMDDAYGGIS